jgi:hypothetical protein
MRDSAMPFVQPCAVLARTFPMPVPTQWQHIRNEINTAFIFARRDFVKVHRVEKQLLFRAAIFAKQKTNTAEQETSPDCQSH